MQEDDLELGVWLALLHQELVGLLTQGLVHRYGVDQGTLDLHNRLVHDDVQILRVSKNSSNFD